MNVEDLSSFALQRVNAYEGLAVDATIWNDAHSYHNLAQRLHTRAFHGWGIAIGLEVQAPPTLPGRGIVLQPGLAIDRDGNPIRVPQAVRLPAPQVASGTICFVLRFAENPVNPPGGGQPVRSAEFFHLVAAPPPLKPNDIEVARVEVADGTSLFRPAASRWDPKPGELDLRFRRQIRPWTADTLTIGQLALTDQAAPGLNRQGLGYLAQELQASAPFAVQFIGDVRAEQAVGQCDLLYLCGAGPVRLTPREGAQILAFLRSGGVLFAEPSFELETQRQENGRFVATLQRLFIDLKQDLEALTPSHPLFNTRHVFSAPPEGLGGHAAILGRSSIILNPNDYGSCWQGGTPSKPLSREQIRSATEFGVNAAWYAADPVARRARLAEAAQQLAAAGQPTS